MTAASTVSNGDGMPRGRCQGPYGAALVGPRPRDSSDPATLLVERTLRLLFTLLHHTISIPYLMTLRVMISQLLFITISLLPFAKESKPTVKELPDVPLLRRYSVLLRQHSPGLFSACTVQARRSFGGLGAHILPSTTPFVGVSSSL